MADWIDWLVAAGLLVELELFTGTFYLHKNEIGKGMAGLVAQLWATVPLQAIAAAVVGVIST